MEDTDLFYVTSPIPLSGASADFFCHLIVDLMIFIAGLYDIMVYDNSDINPCEGNSSSQPVLYNIY